jgi:hypothetical protein
MAGLFRVRAAMVRSPSSVSVARRNRRQDRCAGGPGGGRRDRCRAHGFALRMAWPEIGQEEQGNAGSRDCKRDEWWRDENALFVHAADRKRSLLIQS